MKTFLTLFLSAVFLFASACSLQQPEPSFSDHVQYAMQYDGLVQHELQPNIDLWLANVGLQGDYNYCASFVAWCLDQFDITEPGVRSARSLDYVTNESIPVRKLVREQNPVHKGDILIWQYGESQSGHAGFAAENWAGHRGFTIEANTSPGPTSDISDNSLRGVFLKERSIDPASYFRPRYLTRVYT